MQGLYAFLDGALAYQPVDEDRLVLADAPGAICGLAFDGRVPPGVVVNHAVGGDQVEAYAAGFQADQEQGRCAALELFYRGCASVIKLPELTPLTTLLAVELMGWSKLVYLAN